MLRKALVVDDDVLCLEVVRNYLEDSGFEVTAALGPVCPMLEQGAEQCCMDRPCYDVVLTDNRMPEMTGVEFLLYLEEHGCKLPNHRKAIISGDLVRNEKNRVEARGYKTFKKPCRLEEIGEWLDSLFA